jgi:hypothetical protein
MTAAFRQKNWRFGKIDNRLNFVREGFADVEVKVGYQARADERIRLYGYAGFIFPTGNKPTAQFVFEPIVGNNHHYGVLYGSHIGLSAWCKGDHQLAFALDFQTRYLFKNHQRRSFDLKDKEFSRYIATYRTPEQAEEAAVQKNVDSGTSGINVFTRRVKVFPGLSVSFLSAFLYTYRCLEIEAGYYFFASQREKVEIQWEGLAAVKDVEGEGKTNRARTMKDNFPGAALPFADYQPLVGRDIDANSPANPAVLSYTAYAALGYYLSEGPLPTLLGLGASYEVSASRGINQWAMWAKFAIQF